MLHILWRLMIIEFISTNIKTTEYAVAQLAAQIIYMLLFENIFLFKLLFLINRKRLKQMKNVCVTDDRIATARETTTEAQNIGLR